MSGRHAAEYEAFMDPRDEEDENSEPPYWAYVEPPTEYEWTCTCHQCDPNDDEPFCTCPHNIVTHKNGEQWHGTLSGYTDGCPIHHPPGYGCPNPDCGETWVKSFVWPKCQACGWTADVIHEEPDASDLMSHA